MNTFTLTIITLITVSLSSCSSTSSTMVSSGDTSTRSVAVLPLDGEFGEQASDLIVEQLGSQGVSVVDRSSLDAVLREQDFRRDSRFDQSSLAQYGKLLGVKKIMAGTTTAASGPLYSYRHVNITLKVIDVSTGRVTWIGRYGNSLWSSAISTQGDLQRGAKHIVKEFTRIHGTDF